MRTCSFSGPYIISLRSFTIAQLPTEQANAPSSPSLTFLSGFSPYLNTAILFFLLRLGDWTVLLPYVIIVQTREDLPGEHLRPLYLSLPPNPDSLSTHTRTPLKAYQSLYPPLLPFTASKIREMVLEDTHVKSTSFGRFSCLWTQPISLFLLSFFLLSFLSSSLLPHSIIITPFVI
jgi:hypothetical protein